MPVALWPSPKFHLTLASDPPSRSCIFALNCTVCPTFALKGAKVAPLRL